MTTQDDLLKNLSFAKISARTQNFRLGSPRALQISADNSRIAFVRSDHAASAVNSLYVVDITDAGLGEEKVIVDPRTLSAGDEDLPAEERARRERMRETTAGVTAYSADSSLTTAVFALSGELWVTSLLTADSARRLDVPGPVIDPRLSPIGTHAAFVAGGAVHVVDIASGIVTTLATPENDDITYGLVNFVAAEELNRYRGYWWSPDGAHLLIERVDNAPVTTWWIADPANPQSPAHPHKYPAAGTANPALQLHIVAIDGSSRVLVQWDAQAFEYLVTAGWQKGHGPLLTVMNRRQDRQLILTVDAATGTTTTEYESSDDCWVEWIDGLPAWTPDDTLLVHIDDLATNTRRIAKVRGGVSEAFTPAGLQMASILTTTDSGVLVSATPDSPYMQAHSITWDGTNSALAGTDDEGWHSTVVSGDGSLLVVASSSLRDTTTTWRVLRAGVEIGTLSNLAAGPQDAQPPVTPIAELVHLGELALRTIVIFPTGHVRGSARLPLIMSPYGGPHAVSALAHLRSHSRAQFLADQGFAVAITDNRGTPWRGPVWEREVFRDLSTKVLEDQVAAVEALGEMYPGDIDTSRVGIRGWSFGGYLAALAVLDAPDTFHAAVAGAPVTEWRLYDTGYTERYMGDPETDKSAYDACSLLPKAPKLRRPLLLIHGLADDNVVVAHSLQLSGALLAAGKDHEFLPLVGVTHMTPQETISENLLIREVEFFANHLCAGPSSD